MAGQTRLYAQTLEEVRVIQQLAAQDLDGHRAFSHPNLLGEENRTDAPFAQ